jgi:hypothetical protein
MHSDRRRSSVATFDRYSASGGRPTPRGTAPSRRSPPRCARRSPGTRRRAAVRHARRRVRAARRVGDAVHQVPADVQRPERRRPPPAAVHQLLAGEVALCAAPRKSWSKNGSSSRICPLPARSARLTCTRRRPAGSPAPRPAPRAAARAGVRRRHRAQVGVEREEVRAEPGAGRQERQPPRRGLQAEQQHALVELAGASSPDSRARRKYGSSGMTSSVTNENTACAPCRRRRACRRRGRRRRRA